MFKTAEQLHHFSIRNREHWQALPSLVPIREAIIGVFDYWEAQNIHSYWSNTFNEYDNLFPKSLIPVQFYEQYFHVLTKEKCDEAVYFVGSYLETHYPDVFKAYIISAHDTSLKAFALHFVLVVKDLSHQKWLALSPANIFNPRGASNPYVADEEYLPGGMPRLGRQNFVRSTDVLAADSYPQLINQLKKLENGRWPKMAELGDLTVADHLAFNSYLNSPARRNLIQTAISRKVSL